MGSLTKFYFTTGIWIYEENKGLANISLDISLDGITFCSMKQINDTHYTVSKLLILNQSCTYRHVF